MSERNRRKRVSLNAAISVVAACAACTHAPPASFIKEDLQEMSATVEAIDHSNRFVVLAGANGQSTGVVVAPHVRNFDQVRMGDRVLVQYYGGVAAEVKAAGEGVQGIEENFTTARAAPGERPAAAVGASITTTVAIEAIDTSFNTVTFRRPDGLVRVLAVESPESKRFIRKLKPGNRVQITYTEAVAVSVEPALR